MLLKQEQDSKLQKWQDFKLYWQINLFFKIGNLKMLENSQAHVYNEVIFFIKPLNAKLLILNFSAEIFIFKYF